MIVAAHDLTNEAGACFSPDRRYRYLLWRRWDDGPLLGVVMLNPSIANEEVADPTIRRVIGFAKRDGYGGILVGNAFALVSPYPEDLEKNLAASIGPENDEHLAFIAREARDVVLGYGAVPRFEFRLRAVRRIFPNAKCWGLSKDGYPRHPLYLKADVPMVAVP